ncbi:MAG: hypothetical protein ACI88C_000006 [Acidimicrobiales bacterium]|jgi:hypothetical protein
MKVHFKPHRQNAALSIKQWAVIHGGEHIADIHGIASPATWGRAYGAEYTVRRGATEVLHRADRLNAAKLWVRDWLKED